MILSPDRGVPRQVRMLLLVRLRRADVLARLSLDTANALKLRDREREIFLQASLNAMQLFCLKACKRVAKSHLINYWSATPDNEVELEDAVREELETED